MKNYFETVYQIVKQIPYGKVTTYGAIAASIGSKQGARMVGWALNSTKTKPSEIPAHRVVNRKGLLTGKRHFYANNMKELLTAEGIEIIDNQIIDFEKHFWNPLELENEVDKIN